MSEIDTTSIALIDAMAAAIDPANYYMTAEDYGGGRDAADQAAVINDIARKKARAALAAITAANYAVRPAIAAEKESAGNDATLAIVRARLLAAETERDQAIAMADAAAEFAKADDAEIAAWRTRALRVEAERDELRHTLDSVNATLRSAWGQETGAILADAVKTAAERDAASVRAKDAEARAERMRAALVEVCGCFEAARVEGLDRCLGEEDFYAPGSLVDLVSRRLMFADQAARAALAEQEPKP